ncbi:hypothetical protein L3Q67_01520 [Saccharothrix sp. AJ9571]|nr:hypothetical protein L3Q67_01520 [Saccharothrix sp. AJ9571]
MSDASEDRASGDSPTPSEGRPWSWGGFAAISVLYLIVSGGTMLVARVRLDAGSTHRTPKLSGAQEWLVLLAPLGAAIGAILAGLAVRWWQRRKTSNLVDAVSWTTVFFVLLFLLSCAAQDQVINPGADPLPAPVKPTMSQAPR